MHGRGALHRGVDRQIADIAVVEPQLEFFGQRQRVEGARGGEGPVDHRFGHAMPGGIEEADLLAGMPDRGGEALQRARRTGEDRGEIEYRDLRRRRVVILDPEFLEQIHRDRLKL